MSLTVLCTGRMLADPELRTTNSGRPYTRARVVAGTDGGDTQLVTVIAFGHIGDQVAELGKGDTVAVTGRARLEAWTHRDGEPQIGLTLKADALLTQYHVRRRRKAMVPAVDRAADGADQGPDQ